MENYKFCQNQACEFFPCHKGVDDENFNCLFCYCPLYVLGNKCGGNFKYLENGMPLITKRLTVDGDIVKEPKNSLLRQYTKLFALDDVEITFEDAALEAIAQRAIDRGTGARGLRAIMEELLLDTMYEVPSKKDEVGGVLIRRETVVDGEAPVYIPREKLLPDVKENVLCASTSDANEAE